MKLFVIVSLHGYFDTTVVLVVSLLGYLLKMKVGGATKTLQVSVRVQDVCVCVCVCVCECVCV